MIKRIGLDYNGAKRVRYKEGDKIIIGSNWMWLRGFYGTVVDKYGKYSYVIKITGYKEKMISKIARDKIELAGGDWKNTTIGHGCGGRFSFPEERGVYMSGEYLMPIIGTTDCGELIQGGAAEEETENKGGGQENADSNKE